MKFGSKRFIVLDIIRNSKTIQIVFHQKYFFINSKTIAHRNSRITSYVRLTLAAASVDVVIIPGEMHKNQVENFS